MEVEYALLCENAILNETTRNVSLIEVFDEIKTQGFPAIQPKFVIVIGTKGEQGQHQLSVRIAQEGGSPPVTQDAQINISENGGRNRFLGTIGGLLFPAEGLYKVSIYIENNREPIKELSLRLRLERS